jgi:carbamoyl-phosphate synthase large subunit
VNLGTPQPTAPGAATATPAQRPKPKSALIIGSGPVVIGQAAEFDYAGTQACRALRAEGVRTILVNSNPATIMTDAEVADVVYLEPLTVEAIEQVIAKERPEGLLAGLGGQTALNLAVALAKAGVLDKYNVRLIGTPLEAIEMAEDRELFRDLLDRIGQPYAPSWIVEGATDEERDREAHFALEKIGLPAIIRPAFTLGGTGGGVVETEEAYWERVRGGLRLSPIHQVMVERCLVGWQEIEYEVMRDADDTCIAVCSMENVDPLGVHTGDSIVVAPVQTLPDPVHQRLRSASLAIIRALGVEGGCNIQFALSPDYTDYAVIEVNPRVSRSSALASKATGYPIARVAAQIAAGRRLAEIPNVVTGTTVAAFEPALDYLVVKLPRFPFDKFPTADRTLGSQMKATGEVMAIDRTFGSALNKALRALEQVGAGWLAENAGWQATLDYLMEPAPTEPVPVPIDGGGLLCEARAHAERAAYPIVLKRFLAPSDSRLWRILALLRRGMPAETIRGVTGISAWFLSELERTIGLEREVRRFGARIADPADEEAATLLATVKREGFGDRELAQMAGVTAEAVRLARMELGLVPGYAMVDTCAAEFAAETPYFYATYAAAGTEPELPPVPRPAALVIGSGPVRIGQGIEFDYCAVQAAAELQEQGWQAVMINSNPETVSTDFDASSRLYFEPLDSESVRSVVEAESPNGEDLLGAFVQFGGQTPLNLAEPLAAAGIPLLGANLETIDQAEDRLRFANLVELVGIPQPEGGMGRSGSAGSDRPLSGGRRGGRGRHRRRRDGADPGLARARRAGGRALGRFDGGVPAADGLGLGPGADRRFHGPDRSGAGRARAGQRPVHRPRGRRLPDRGQSAGQPHGPVHEQGHGRADGQAGGPDRVGRDARRHGLAERAPGAAAAGRGQGAGLLHGQAAWRRPLRRAGHAVHGRGHRAAYGPARGPGQGDAGRGADPAAAGRGWGPRPHLRRGTRPRRAAEGRRRPGAGGLSLRRHRRDGGGAGEARP